MNIPKAIKILSESANEGMTTFNQDFKDAELLGIEALKRVKGQRSTRGTVSRCFLPGETEE